jgi:hypothetical protein
MYLPLEWNPSVQKRKYDDINHEMKRERVEIYQQPMVIRCFAILTHSILQATDRKSEYFILLAAQQIGCIKG